MRFGSTAKVLAECKLKHYTISECVLPCLKTATKYSEQLHFVSLRPMHRKHCLQCMSTDHSVRDVCMYRPAHLDIAPALRDFSCRWEYAVCRAIAHHEVELPGVHLAQARRRTIKLVHDRAGLDKARLLHGLCANLSKALHCCRHFPPCIQQAVDCFCPSLPILLQSVLGCPSSPSSAFRTHHCHTTKFGNTAKALAECKLKYYRISECAMASSKGNQTAAQIFMEGGGRSRCSLQGGHKRASLLLHELAARLALLMRSPVMSAGLRA